MIANHYEIANEMTYPVNLRDRKRKKKNVAIDFSTPQLLCLFNMEFITKQNLNQKLQFTARWEDFDVVYLHKNRHKIRIIAWKNSNENRIRISVHKSTQTTDGISKIVSCENKFISISINFVVIGIYKWESHRFVKYHGIFFTLLIHSLLQNVVRHSIHFISTH